MQNSDCGLEHRLLVYSCEFWAKGTSEIAFCTRQWSHVLQSYIFHKELCCRFVLFMDLEF